MPRVDKALSGAGQPRPARLLAFQPMRMSSTTQGILALVLGIAVFFTASVMTRNPELLFFLDHLKRKIVRR